MDSQDLRNLYEAYSNLYEQQIGVPLKDASDRAAKEQLKKMIPKGEKIHTPKATLQNAAYEPEGDEIEEDVRSRDVNARGGFDPRFDRKPKTTGIGQVKTPGGPVKTPGGPVSTPRPTGPVAQAPKPNVGGVLGQLDKIARNTAGDIGSRIGEREGRNRTGNLPIISDIGGAIGRKQGREKGQRTYDNLKNTAIRTVGGLLKQDYEPDAFDVILEYLVAEGYADTNDNALVIMANMSEEWRETIIEAEVLAMKGGVPGSVKVRPTLSIPGTNIGVGPNKPVPGTFTTTTPGQREKIKQGDTHIDRGVGGMQPRQGAGPTGEERRRYNSQVARSRTPGKPMPQ